MFEPVQVAVVYDLSTKPLPAQTSSQDHAKEFKALKTHKIDSLRTERVSDQFKSCFRLQSGLDAVLNFPLWVSQITGLWHSVPQKGGGSSVL